MNPAEREMSCHLDPETESLRKELSLRSLQRIDRTIVDVVQQCTYVSVYEINAHIQKWERADVEGFLYIVRRSIPPIYRLIIMNQKNKDNLIEDVTSEWEVSSRPNYIFYRVPAEGNKRIGGLWFFDDSERSRVLTALEEITAILRSPPKTNTGCAKGSSLLAMLKTGEENTQISSLQAGNHILSMISGKQVSNESQSFPNVAGFSEEEAFYCHSKTLTPHDDLQKGSNTARSPSAGVLHSYIEVADLEKQLLPSSDRSAETEEQNALNLSGRQPNHTYSILQQTQVECNTNTTYHTSTTKQECVSTIYTNLEAGDVNSVRSTFDDPSLRVLLDLQKSCTTPPLQPTFTKNSLMATHQPVNHVTHASGFPSEASCCDMIDLVEVAAASAFGDSNLSIGAAYEQCSANKTAVLPMKELKITENDLKDAVLETVSSPQFLNLLWSKLVEKSSTGREYHCS